VYGSYAAVLHIACANNFTGPLNLTGCTNLTVLDLQVGGFCGALGARVQLWS
jgi:hypothetical protein